jgi:hypothetical protein
MPKKQLNAKDSSNKVISNKEKSKNNEANQSSIDVRDNKIATSARKGSSNESGQQRNQQKDPQPVMFSTSNSIQTPRTSPRRNNSQTITSPNTSENKQILKTLSKTKK